MIKNNRYDLGMKLGQAKVWINDVLVSEAASVSFHEVFADVDNLESDAAIVDKVCSLVASVMPGMPIPDKAFALTAHAYLYQDDDAHETCSLTACLNPLHPGPCKGWKGTLFKTSEGAYHALEAARVEKANTARLKKIQALKDAGKPIPKKLLQPIVAKPHPHAGKTANAATGEAHAAGQAVTEAAGVHVQMPGKVTLGQAVKQIKATDATTEKGKLGKKPTVASKGIAAVIAQEKVTPQYKLDKAAKITPEQWNALSGDERAIIRGELTKIQTEGFGPQQKKATELLDALPAKGLKGGGTDTVTTPKGQVVHKINLKDINEGPPTKAPSPVQAPEGEMAGPDSLSQANALKNITEAVHGLQKMTVQDVAKNVDKMKSGGNTIDKHPEFAGIVGKLANAAQKKAYAQKQTDIPGIDVYYQQIADHIKEGKPLLPKVITDLLENHKPGAISTDASTLGKTLNKAATPQKFVYSVTHNGETVTRTSSAPYTHASLVQKGHNGPVVVWAFHQSEANALGTPLTSMQKQNGFKVVGALPVTKEPLKKAEKEVPKPNVKEGIEQAAKAAHEAKVAEAKPKLGDLKPETPKIENAAPSAPEKPATLPKHVQHAIDMATGKAPGASWSKNHLAAYEKLTPEEFAALPPDIQSKVIQELKKGATKFQDPKKIQATSDLLKKFKGGLEASKPAAPSEPGFHSHLHDHAVTDAQAKKLAAEQPVATHAAVANVLAGLDLSEQPDVMAHHIAAQKHSKNVLTALTKDEPPDALKDPAVQQASQDVLDAATTLKQAQLVGQAKKNAYNKIEKTLKGDTGKLSPIQKASLAEYQKYLLAHPTNTDPEEIAKLQAGLFSAYDQFHAALKAAKTPKPDEMTPAQLDSKIGELLGPDAVKPQVNLTMAELKEANATGEAMAKLGTEKYSPATLENPEVAAKMKAVAQVAGQLAATAENKKKLQAHLAAHHFKALNDHDAGVGHFNAPQIAAIKAHAEKIKKEHAYLDDVTKKQQDQLMAARKEFDKVADEVQAAPKEPVTLSEYDQNTVSEAFGNSWTKAASKAVTYGLKTYSQKLEMKGHAEYPAFTQDLGNLQTAVKNLAVAHAAERVAELNVPIDPDTGAKLDGPEKKAWLSAVTARMDAEKQYNQLYKVAQTRLDKIRTDIGLTKRALPKIDSPAVKAAAAESGYYKTAGYGGPNYGKQAKAKNYILAKVGPKLGVVHQSVSEKKAEKAAAEAEKLKAAHPDFYAKKEADKAAAAAKPKVAVADAGKTPSQAAAEKHGWSYAPSTGSPLGDWSYSAGGAYYANPDHLKEAQDILSSPDVQYGLAAQKQYKWSINNMESKGASHSWKQSLFSYTGSGYGSVNEKLNSLPPGVAKTGSTTISNIDKGIEASPELEADTVLYRGFKSPHTVFASGKWNDTNVAGMEWSQRSYSSTSGALSTAEGFAGYGGVVMRIIIPKGMKVHGINAKGGQHPGENEIILQRGLRYRVVADYGTHGSKRYIDVMVVPNPYAQPE